MNKRIILLLLKGLITGIILGRCLASEPSPSPISSKRVKENIQELSKIFKYSLNIKKN